MQRKKTSMTFDEGLLSRVDAARGDVARSRWIERAIEGRLIRDTMDSLPISYSGPLSGSVLTFNHAGLHPAERDVEPHFKETKKKRSHNPNGSPGE